MYHVKMREQMIQFSIKIPVAILLYILDLLWHLYVLIAHSESPNLHFHKSLP